MPKYKVLIAQFPGGHSTHVEPTNYAARIRHQMACDPRVGADNVLDYFRSDTPITMTRNQALLYAEVRECDYVVMIDSDMHPDCICAQDGAKPFWETSWEFILQNRCGMIAAPYCGPPPNECVYAFRWNTEQAQQPNPNMRLEMYDRDTASKMRGIQKAAALATGLCILDMRAVKELPHPRFEYEWKDRNGKGEEKCPHCCQAIPGERVDKASTEDVYFSRNLTYKGWPIYCNWDAWAGHYKLKLVGPPQKIPINMFPAMMRGWADALPTAAMPDPYSDVGPRAAVDATASDTRADDAAPIVQSNRCFAAAGG